MLSVNVLFLILVRVAYLCSFVKLIEERQERKKKQQTAKSTPTHLRNSLA